LGAAVAILYAPRSGAVTRRFIRAKANSSVGYVKNKATGVGEAVQNGKTRLSAAYQAGRDAYSATVNAPLA
jgi:gas vesicle protein